MITQTTKESIAYTPSVYTEKHSQAAFLLGGIGTGNISVGARGELRDFEIFNVPGKGNFSAYTFFSIRSQVENEEPIVRVLEAEIQPPYTGSIGFQSEKVGCLPRFTSSKMTSEYPFVHIDLEDASLPLEVSMESFTPFVPLDPSASGIPGAIIRYKVKNTDTQPRHTSIAGSLNNLVGFKQNTCWGNTEFDGKRRNEEKKENNLTGVYFTCEEIPTLSSKYGSMALLTADTDVTTKANWYEGQWWDGLQEFWNDFCDDGKIENPNPAKDTHTTNVGHFTNPVGSLCIDKTIQPGEEAVFEFFLTWYMPNRPDAWHCDPYHYGLNERTIKNYYATMFDNAWHVGDYLANHLATLEDTSRKFANALYTSTYPSYVIDAIANNITVLRSTTCFRLANGLFAAWEGSHDQVGSCAGTCTHVWNYAQTLAFLFPTLEQSARTNEFTLETEDDGKMNFRSHKIFGDGDVWDMHPASDGQSGTIMRLYREWKLSGDNDFLANVWPNVKKSIDFITNSWDKDGDHVLEEVQHNTYDIEFEGISSLTNSLYFGALKAVSEMAEAMGERELAVTYMSMFEKGSQKMDELTFNGSYYIQKVDDINARKYQYGTGCLSDQLLGQTFAHLYGLGYILPKDHVKKAVKSIYDLNYRKDMYGFHNVQRTYALNDEKGLILCSWPEGGRPNLPFVYSDEVWTGIEYHVATHLIYEGYIDEGLSIVKGTRERYDGIRRNPWSEVECGYHYARSMASWGIMIALSGYTFDMTKDEADIHPKINEDNFSTFYSNGKEWGTYSQKLVNGELIKNKTVLGTK